MHQNQDMPYTRRLLLLAGAAAALGRSALASADWQEAPLPALQSVLDEGQRWPALRALLVARDGVLVGERYYGGTTAAQLQRINSATEGIMSILVGQVIEQGKLGLAQTIGELLPEVAARRPDAALNAVTLQQVLSGTTGVAYDFQRDFEALGRASDPIAHVQDLAVNGSGPQPWSYNDAAISLLAPVLEKVHGAKVRDLAQRQLFAPLGIDAFDWQRDRAGRELSYAGLRLRPRDLLKIASTMAAGGSWQGARVVPAAWATESMKPGVPAGWRPPPVTQVRYGYLWFTGMLGAHPVAWAWGYGAQYALVVPSLRIAVVTSAQEPPPARLVAQNTALMTLVASAVEAVATQPPAGASR
jgi:CubicO group peptidase (beta-lactamase class C family)